MSMTKNEEIALEQIALLLKRKDVAKFFKEFRTLVKGESLVLKLPHEVHLSWQSDTSVYPEVKKIKNFNWNSISEARRYEARIKRCAKLGDKLAKKYGIKRSDFWHSIIEMDLDLRRARRRYEK